MDNKTLKISILALSTAAITSINAQITETATEAVQNMGVGWNLGNTLDANGQNVTDVTKDNYWGAQGLESETYWGQSITTPTVFEMMKNAGFGAIRIPVTWYNHMDNRIKDGGYYDGWDYYESSSSDKPMNDHTKATLNGVSTLKLGMEYKPIPMLAVRVGYNYVSALYKEDGVRDQTLMCSYDADGNTGVNMATSTDYTNWKAINRFTLGLGFNYKKMFLDLAYQYSTQDGDFYPFMSSKKFGTKEGFTPAISNEVSATKVSNNRHQLLMTLGYKF